MYIWKPFLVLFLGIWFFFFFLYGLHQLRFILDLEANEDNATIDGEEGPSKKETDRKVCTPYIDKWMYPKHFKFHLYLIQFLEISKLAAKFQKLTTIVQLECSVILNCVCALSKTKLTSIWLNLSLCRFVQSGVGNQQQTMVLDIYLCIYKQVT